MSVRTVICAFYGRGCEFNRSHHILKQVTESGMNLLPLLVAAGGERHLHLA